MPGEKSASSSSESLSARLLVRRRFISRLGRAAGVAGGLLAGAQVASASQTCPATFTCERFECSNPFYCGVEFDCLQFHGC